MFLKELCKYKKNAVVTERGLQDKNTPHLAGSTGERRRGHLENKTLFSSTLGGPVVSHP